MKIKMNHSLEVAYKVLHELENILSKESKNKLILESFSNCREQGLSLYNVIDKTRVCFAEHKNSDQIIIYYGTYYNDFDITTNTPKDWTKYCLVPDVTNAAINLIKLLIY